ncbi:MAG: hypothetical protein Q9169_003675 [Polycauliona sp. 2 TL-2023]
MGSETVSMQLLRKRTSIDGTVSALYVHKFHTMWWQGLDKPEQFVHGNAGTVAQGWRTDTYRSLSSAAPDRIHVLAVDYRGFGLSTGTPDEQGLITDGIATVQWAMDVAKIPPERIALVGQSLGTAVAAAVAEHFVRMSGLEFPGVVLIAAFSDMPTLLLTYSIKDDFEILWKHSEALFYAAANATSASGLSIKQMEAARFRQDLHEGGSIESWNADGMKRITKQIVRYGALPQGNLFVSIGPIIAGSLSNLTDIPQYLGCRPAIGSWAVM